MSLRDNSCVDPFLVEKVDQLSVLFRMEQAFQLAILMTSSGPIFVEEVHHYQSGGFKLFLPGAAAS